MGKPTICVFVFATRIVQFLFYLNPKFRASSSFLRLNRPVCVGPVPKPHCWFSHEAAHFILYEIGISENNYFMQNASSNDIGLRSLDTIFC